MALFRLALALGRTVREIETTMDFNELMEWLAFMRLEPLGEIRADYRAGMISSVLANCNRGKDTKAFQPEDFMPFYDKPKTPIKALPSGRALMRDN